MKEEYPTLILFKPGVESELIYHGPKDKDSIEIFLQEQFTSKPKVSFNVYLYFYVVHLSDTTVYFSSEVTLNS